MTVFDSWGSVPAKRGQMVFNLIGAGLFWENRAIRSRTLKRYDFDGKWWGGVGGGWGGGGGGGRLGTVRPLETETVNARRSLQFKPATSTSEFLPVRIDEHFTLAVGHQLPDQPPVYHAAPL